MLTLFSILGKMYSQKDDDDDDDDVDDDDDTVNPSQTW